MRVPERQLKELSKTNTRIKMARNFIFRAIFICDDTILLALDGFFVGNSNQGGFAEEAAMLALKRRDQP